MRRSVALRSVSLAEESAESWPLIVLTRVMMAARAPEK